MKTVERHDQINELLKDIDARATKAINAGLKFTVEYRDNGITEKQYGSLHVWFRWCSEYLNSIGAYQCTRVSGRRVPWTEKDFKDGPYKTLLKRWKGKMSTKDQNSKDPEEIRLALSGHLATEYSLNIQLPEWPSLR